MIYLGILIGIAITLAGLWVWRKWREYRDAPYLPKWGGHE
jgi:hypothetical protein